VYILGSVHIAVMFAVKHSAKEVTSRDIFIYMMESVHIAVMCAVRHSAIDVT
jgi:hypothetical protein